MTRVVITKESADERGDTLIPGLVLELDDDKAKALIAAGTAAESDADVTTDFGEHTMKFLKKKGG